jgi:hypothetical protein
MTTRLDRRRARLRAAFGFDFPDDFLRFWEFASSLRPLEPLRALEDTGIVLVGAFEVLAGRFDGHTPRYDLRLHWRYHDDPPEFCTLLAGNIDGLHWGYYLDDPAAAEGGVAHYYARDAFELATDGDTLFEAVRLQLEYLQRDNEDGREAEPDRAAEYDDQLRRLDALRERLTRHATGDRAEVSDAYTDRYAGRSARNGRVAARTMEGMGIVVPPGQYRPLSLPDKQLWRRLRRESDPAEVVEEARQALADGFPGTALKVGKDLWATEGEQRMWYAYELLESAYEALGREELRRVLLVHRANRDLPSVDILEMEEE